MLLEAPVCFCSTPTDDRLMHIVTPASVGLSAAGDEQCIEQKRSSVNCHLSTAHQGGRDWCLCRRPLVLSNPVHNLCPTNRMVLASLSTGKTLLMAQSCLFGEQAVMGEGLALVDEGKWGVSRVRIWLLWTPAISQNHKMLQCFL